MRISHLSCAHALWKNFVSPNDVVVDATLGNGQDALFLAKLLKGQGTLLGYDIQKKSIDHCEKLFSENSSITKHLNYTFYLCSHEEIEASFPSLIVYNLGYLPKGDKNLTTLLPSTIKSLEKAMKIIKTGGVISVTCYPGHPEGKKELDYFQDLFTYLPQYWKSFSFQSPLPNAPVLFLFQKEPMPLASKKSSLL